MPEGGIGTLLGSADPVVQQVGAVPTEEQDVGAPLSALSEEATTATAVPTAPAPVGFLGRAQASLGNPREPGLWVLTQYVSKPMTGSVVVPSSGASLELELRPSGGASARLSLEAMQALGLPLTALQEVEIYGAASGSDGGGSG